MKLGNEAVLLVVLSSSCCNDELSMSVLDVLAGNHIPLLRLILFDIIKVPRVPIPEIHSLFVNGNAMIGDR